MRRIADGLRPVKVLSVLGTRPEAIKMAPVVLELGRRPDIVSKVCVTAQHREMLDEVLSLFEVTPDHDLDIMTPGQSPTGVAAEIMRHLEPVLADERPDWVLVQGDTTTAAVAAIAAFYGGAQVAHVEAGLRSRDQRDPFPEEINRRIVGVTADLHFAPTSSARENLLDEGVSPESVLVTGNPVIDALQRARTLPSARDCRVAGLTRDCRVIVMTAHRRESFGEPLERVCTAVTTLAERFPDVRFVYPVHPNPSVRAVVEDALGAHPSVTLLEPLGYREMVTLLERCHLVLTDSGGLQEEAPSLGKPVLVLRDVTERWEGVEAGTARLVGTDTHRIVEETSAVLESPGEYALMSEAINPYGDGRASERIADALSGRDVPDWTEARGYEPERRALR
ncbi:MAG TPA: UDP-N-acetylglucosamine 2-epimerase (non-hydrolyzing) [Gaiellaceae bacterium]|nr:UDP-N-acetylglucosamine 2-epimerase (non-hydrolyzing) [Gaiellaceae bacterium]